MCRWRASCNLAPWEECHLFLYRGSITSLRSMVGGAHVPLIARCGYSHVWPIGPTATWPPDYLTKLDPDSPDYTTDGGYSALEPSGCHAEWADLARSCQWVRERGKGRKNGAVRGWCNVSGWNRSTVRVIYDLFRDLLHGNNVWLCISIYETPYNRLIMQVYK